MANISAAPRSFIRHALPGILSIFLSVGLHASVAAPYLIHLANTYSPEAMGEDVPENEPVGEDGSPAPAEAAVVEMIAPIAPVNIAIYVPPAPTPPPEAEAPPEAPEAVAEATPREATSPNPRRPSNNTSAPAETAPVQTAPQETAQGGTGTGSGRGTGREPCEQLDEVTKISATKWKVQRSIIDFYASHLVQLGKQAGAATARGKGGVVIGVRVYLPRCSHLRQVGLRNKDVITSIDGRPVATLAQAVKTWLALRNQKNITVQIRRKGGGEITHQYRIIK